MKKHSLINKKWEKKYVCTIKKNYGDRRNAEKVVEQFSKPGIIEQQEGFVDIKIMVKKQRDGKEKSLSFTWESEEHWKRWEKSGAHIAARREKRNHPKPEYMLNVEVGMYEVKAVKERNVKQAE